MKIISNGAPKFLKQKFSFSGAHIFGEDFLKHLSQSNHSYVGMVFLKSPKPVPDNFIVQTVKQKNDKWFVMQTQIPTADILSLSSNRPSPNAISVVNKIGQLMKEEKADLFYLNGFSALAYLLFKAAVSINLPIVVGHHGIWIKESQAIMDHSKISNIALRKQAEADLARYSKKNIFLTLESVKEYRKHVGKIPDSKITIIPLPYNPVFLNQSPPKRHNRTKLKIGMVARWDKIKNHEAYLATASEATKQGLQWEFYAVTSMNQYKPYARLEAPYRKLIKIIPQCPPNKLKKFYQKMDVLILPSVFETYSGVVMEALLQNRPILISPHIPWAKTLKSHGLGAWVQDFKNPAKTVKILQLAAQTPIPLKLVKTLIKTNKPQAIYSEYLKTFKSAINQ